MSLRPDYQSYSKSLAVTNRTAYGTNVCTMLSAPEYEAFDAIARKLNMSKAAVLRSWIRERIRQEQA